MRVRMVTALMAAVVIAIVALGGPLALLSNFWAEQQLRNDRLSDTSWFAALAERPLVETAYTDLRAHAAQYHHLYGITVLLVDTSQEILMAPDRLSDADRSELLRNESITSAALAGRPAQSKDITWPWTSRPLIVAVPVIAEGRILGAAVTISPTRPMRVLVATRWALFGLGAVVLAGLALLTAVRLGTWILQPVRRLEARMADATRDIEIGRTAVPLGSPEGPPELVGLERSFDHLQKRLACLLERQSAFATDASHQLRNPLTALRIRLLAVTVKVDRGLQEELGSALREVHRLSELVDGMLALAKAENRPARTRHCRLRAVIDSRTEAWSPLAELESVRLVVHDTVDGYALASPDDVETVLDVVIDNALRFAPPTTDIELSVVAADPDTLEVRVRDHGPGLPADDHGKAVQRFWRGPGQDPLSGTGLGLPIAASLAHRNNGRLTLRSPREGNGVEAVLTLLRTSHSTRG
ncbi:MULTISPECIES: HAMP domain-containing sensor histidine kinase [unclassified Pseudonocardia]|uniref:sensor histidine kinase n=1 Tax=unclassified Pseudonocardia TaxID=2619320 RepID=UPI00094B3ABD|nr:HAMP domain-containing sensor histidine kinase [Pseudonocardia sp. Ae707_Ps1]OLM16159.1 Sensor protein [Pseudonocardia sp. Ae707_Ps1]